MHYKAKNAYSSDDKKLGHIVHTTPDYFLLQRGILISKTRYLPAWLLCRSDADRAYLGGTRASVEALARRDLPVEGDAWYTTDGKPSALPGAARSAITPAVTERGDTTTHTGDRTDTPQCGVHRHDGRAR